MQNVKQERKLLDLAIRKSLVRETSHVERRVGGDNGFCKNTMHGDRMFLARG